MILPLVLGTLAILALTMGSKKSTGETPGVNLTSVGDPRNPINTLPDSLRVLAGQAIATNDPATLKQVAAQLDAQGFSVQANLLRQQANVAVATKEVSSAGTLPDNMKVLLAQALAALTVTDSGAIAGPITAQAIQIASNIQGQLRDAGFPQAANDLGNFVAMAQRLLPTLPPSQQLPLPGLSPDLQTQVNQAIQTIRDPVKLRQLEAVLKSMPPNPQTQQAIDTIDALATQIEATQAAAQAMQQIQNEANKTPGALPNIPPASPPPPPGTVVLPQMVIPGTPPPPITQKSKQQIKAESVATGLKRLQEAAGGNVKQVQGKEDKAGVMSFQSQESLTADGKAGPATTAALGKYTGDLPLVMYWPQGSNASSVIKYRAGLNTLADNAEASGDQTRADALRASAFAERGQGGIVGPMPA